jgi:lipopolysaccharide exporter
MSPGSGQPSEAVMSAPTGLGKLGRAALWSTVNTAVVRLGQFAVSIVTARLISPHEFGVFVVAFTIYLIVINVSEIGVSSALVREVDNADRIAPTVSTIAMVTSAALATAVFVSAPVLAGALGASAATNAVRVLALPVLLAGPTAVPAALLVRDFRQGTKLLADMGNFIVATGTLLALALNGQGVMALAWSRVAGQLVTAVLLLVVAPRRYRPGFNRKEARRLLRFGAPLAGANLAGLGLANVDFMAIGRLAGPLQLGYYNLAFTVSGWPSSVFTSILYSVTLPALARVKGGVSEIGRHVAGALAALCAAAFPVTVACMMLAEPLVHIVYGARWAPAAPVLTVLAIFGSARVIISLFSDVLVAVGRTRVLLNLQLLWLAALVPAMIVAVYVGKGVGAAIAQVVVAFVVVLPAYVFVLVRSVGLSLRVLVRPAVYPLIAVVVSGGLAYLVDASLGSPWLKLGGAGACLLVIYVLLLGRWLLRLKGEFLALYRPRRDSEESTVRDAPALTPAGTIERHLEEDGAWEFNAMVGPTAGRKDVNGE